jgi:hypothetical protein
MIRNIHYSSTNASLIDHVQFTNDLFDNSQEDYSGKDRELIENILSKMPAYTGNMIQRHIAGVFSKNSKFSHISFGFNYLLNKPTALASRPSVKKPHTVAPIPSVNKPMQLASIPSVNKPMQLASIPSVNKPCSGDCNTTGSRQSSVHAEEAAIRQWLKNFRLSHLLRRIKYGKWCFLPSERRLQPS